MEGYKFIANTYKKMLDKDDLAPETRAEFESKFKVAEIVSELNTLDIYSMFDLGVFNQITKAYCIRSMELAEVDEGKQEEVLQNLKELFDIADTIEMLRGSRRCLN